MSFESELKQKSDYYTDYGRNRKLPDDQLSVFVAYKLTKWVKLDYPERAIEMDDVVTAMSDAMAQPVETG